MKNGVVPFHSKVDNKHSQKNPVGRFMVAAGAIIELKNTGKILIQKRSADQDWHPSEWEIPYGRLAQFEDIYTGLKRELKEETGLTKVTIIKPLTAWHLFRGHEETAEDELIGITFRCKTEQTKITLSNEHNAYQWVTPREALQLVKVAGIRRDINAFIHDK